MLRKQVTATALAVIVPGLGHLYAGNKSHGVVLLVAVIAWPLAFIVLSGWERSARASAGGSVPQLPYVVLAGFFAASVVLFAWQVYDAFKAVR